MPDEDQLDPSERAAELRHEIEQANYNYYILDSPTIADAEYDALMRELRELEERYPEIRTPESPSQYVSGGVGRGFKAVRHPFPMLSLGNAFSREQLQGWYERIRRMVPNAHLDFVVEPKIDGLAIALTYEKGRFALGATRGNGIEGEDVTLNLRTVRDVPERLQNEPIPDRLEVRGEIFMPTDGFERLNEQRAHQEQPLFANPRNSAAGSLRQLDPEVTAGRPLCLWAYAIGYANGMRLTSQWRTLELLRAWGFPVNDLARPLSDIDAVWEYCEQMVETRDRLSYEIDGVVVKVNSVEIQEELGSVGRDPRWAIAFKFPPRQATTRLADIQVNVGRTGTINPFAVLEPVNIGGVIVRLATLHNQQDIHRKDIRIGDRVIVQRAGDVIPQVVKSIPEERDGTQQIYRLPTNCPSCGTELVQPEGEAMTRCPNRSCPAQMVRWVEHFVSEGAMDIRGLGEALVRVLLGNGLIRDPADLYLLTMDGLLALPGIQEKSATNFLRSIDGSKRRPLANVIFALGIRYVGYQTAELLANAFGDLDVIRDASIEALEAVEGIGRKTAESVAEWTADPQNRDFLQRLKEAGVNWRGTRVETATGPLAGKIFLITGRLDTLTRGEAEARLKSLGAKIAPGMNKSVDYLIAGADPGSKLDRAKKLGTPVKGEDWLTELFDSGRLPAVT